MDLSMFVNGDMGELVDIAGSDPVAGDWRHKAFIPAPLDDDEPVLRGSTYRLVAAGGSRTGAAPRDRRTTREHAGQPARTRPWPRTSRTRRFLVERAPPTCAFD